MNVFKTDLPEFIFHSCRVKNRSIKHTGKFYKVYPCIKQARLNRRY